MGPWLIWLWRLLRNRRFRKWLMATAGPRAIALFALWLDRLRHRQIAIDEADQVDGLFSGAIIDGQRHVIVWKDGEPISAYPPVEGDLAAKLRAHTRRGLTHPEELPTRRARRWAGAVAGRVGGAAGKVRHGAASAGEQARRLPLPKQLKRGRHDAGAAGDGNGDGREARAADRDDSNGAT